MADGAVHLCKASEPHQTHGLRASGTRPRTEGQKTSSLILYLKNIFNLKNFSELNIFIPPKESSEKVLKAQGERLKETVAETAVVQTKFLREQL